MRVSGARIAHVLLVLLAIASLVCAANGRKKKRDWTPPESDDIESQDNEDINMHAPAAAPNAEELDELDDDPPPVQETGAMRVRFANASAPAPPTFPSTPESLGRLSFGLGQMPQNADPYERPTTARERKQIQTEEYLERTFHPWYIFPTEDRRKRYSEMRLQLRKIVSSTVHRCLRCAHLASSFKTCPRLQVRHSPPSSAAPRRTRPAQRSLGRCC